MKSVGLAFSLVFEGEKMNDYKRVEEYGIQGGSVVYLVIHTCETVVSDCPCPK